MQQQGLREKPIFLQLREMDSPTGKKNMKKVKEIMAMRGLIPILV